MNRKYATIGLITSVILIGFTVTFAADSTSLEGGTTATPAATTVPAPATPEPATTTAKVDGTKKALAKVTCEDFLAFDEVIQPKYVIAAEPYAKNAKAKTVIIDVVTTEALVPVLIEECTKTPNASFLTKLKSKLKH